MLFVYYKDYYSGIGMTNSGKQRENLTRVDMLLVNDDWGLPPNSHYPQNVQ